MPLFNHFSFVLVALTLGAALAGALLWLTRRRAPRTRALLLGAALLLYGAGALAFQVARQYPDLTVRTVADVDAVLSNGRPTLVMFYSNY